MAKVKVGLVATLTMMVMMVTVNASSWNYKTEGETGPAHWAGACNTGGKRQSPINLPRRGLEVVKLPALEFHDYNIAPETMHLLNNGHAAKLTYKPFNESRSPRISGAGLGSKYRLAQIHFHWGAENSRGSEHLKSNVSFPMEMHLVHFKDEYPTLADALANPEEDTLAVIGVFFKLQLVDNLLLDRIINGLDNVIQPKDQTQILSLPLENLLPSSVSRMYRYNGSLTTPACNEIVTWTVLQEPVHISLTQLEKFRKLKQEDSSPLVDNFRPAQPIGDRRVLDVYAGSEVSGGARNTLTLSSLLCLFYAVLASTN